MVSSWQLTVNSESKLETIVYTKSGLNISLYFLVRGGGLCLTRSGLNRRMIKGVSGFGIIRRQSATGELIVASLQSVPKVQLRTELSRRKIEFDH